MPENPEIRLFRPLHIHDKKTHQPTVEQVLKEVSPPSYKFIKQVTEQLTISPHMYKAHLHQELQQQQEQEYCASYVFKTELSISCQSDILSTYSPTSLVVNSDHALSDFIVRKDVQNSLIRI